MPFFASKLLKDKLRHIKNCKSLFEQEWVPICRAKPEVSRGGDFANISQGKDWSREGVEAKKGNYLICYSLKLSWLFVIGYP